MSLDLMTTRDKVEELDEYTIVKLTRKQGAMAPVGVQKMNARARAIVEAGLVDVTLSRAEDVSRAIRNVDSGEIRSATGVQREQGREMWIRVNTSDAI